MTKIDITDKGVSRYRILEDKPPSIRNRYDEAEYEVLRYVWDRCKTAGGHFGRQYDDIVSIVTDLRSRFPSWRWAATRDLVEEMIETLRTLDFIREV